jgi:hypothetical protein
LQDEGGGHLVDHLAAPFAAGVGVNERAGDGGGRQPFVPEDDRQRGEAAKVADEGTGRLDARSFRSVHVERQADDQSGDPMFGGQLQQGRRVGLELAPPDGGQRRADPPFRVADGDADGLGAQVEPHQRRLRTQEAGKVFQFGIGPRRIHGVIITARRIGGKLSSGQPEQTHKSGGSR